MGVRLTLVVAMGFILGEVLLERVRGWDRATVVALGDDGVGGTGVLLSTVEGGAPMVVLLRLGVVEAGVGTTPLKLLLRLAAVGALEEVVAVVVEVLPPLTLLLRPEVALVVEAPPLMPRVIEGVATALATPLLELDEDVHSSTTS